MIAPKAVIRRWLPPLALLLLAIGTYGVHYGQPQSLFWDENYHVAAAHKHLAGVMYMEPHPPLGKMLIAAGEWLVGANRDLDLSASLTRDHVSGGQLPTGYRFTGVRLPSVALMILTVLLVYGIVLRITGRTEVAFAFASLLALDNALIVHSRAAMLEGIQLFFVAAALYLFVRAAGGPRPVRLPDYLGLAVAVGLAMAVKINAAVLLVLLPTLLLVDQWPNLAARAWRPLLHRAVLAGTGATVAVAATVLGVYWLHIATGTELAGNRTYKASAAYQTHLREGTAWTPRGFAAALPDHLRYAADYAAGVPRLDMCKPGENGSPAIGWPLAGKAINYRWNADTLDGQRRVAYTYLVANPMVWWPALLGIVLALGLAMSRFVYGQAPTDRRLFAWIMLFTGLYLAYMVAIMRIERVMYLYHYLMPLLFAVVNLALVYAYLFRDSLARGSWHGRANLAALVLLVAGVFAFFAPLTYGIPLTAEQFELRQWLDFWRLEPAR